tara:strand:- start:30116 stop:30850 length:735 start_codon:yes stop_codon:yes gene_type:complete
MDMFKKYLLQCGILTSLLITAILATNQFFSDFYQFSKNIINTIENYALNNHYMSAETLKFFSNLDGEISGSTIAFLGIFLPLAFGTICALIHCFITFACATLTGFHADYFQIHKYNKTKVNKTTQNLLILRSSQHALIVLTGIATTLTALPFTPLYLINSFTTLACCLALALGHLCLTYKYINLLINNTRDEDVLNNIQVNNCIARDIIFYLKHNEMHLVSTKTTIETKDLKLAIVGEEKFIKP